MKSLPKVVDVIPEKCVNCHACISVCPVKFANDASGDYVKVNPNLCIGCGLCVEACTHDARVLVDDLQAFLDAVNNREKIVAISAPAVASSFPNRYMNLNGWLKSIGISAVFDVSFGAELTIKSYLEHIKNDKPKCVIAQPCPAIVSYIEIYRPELLRYLAPADSPMAHTIKMVREFYPQYRNHKFLIISPCAAKKREFEEIGMGDFVVTMLNFSKHFASKGIVLDNFPQTDFDNPPAERAVLFSSPGGLKETALRWNPNLESAIRKIEGVHTIYPYLDTLENSINSGKAPLVIDCLNCEMGCNGGPGTLGRNKSMDEVESLVRERKNLMKKKYAKDAGEDSDPKIQEEVIKQIDKHWKKDLYKRTYVNRSENYSYRQPVKGEVDSIYHELLKHNQSDIKNCTACGYNSCEKMASAIHNGLNRKENCHFYLAALTEKIEENKEKDIKDITLKFETFLKDVEQSMNSLTEIDPVVKEINVLARLTDLLATNATIQAAHAGAYGKTFNVVAKEVKELASRIKNEAGKIKPAADNARKASSEILGKIRELSDNILDVLSHSIK